LLIDPTARDELLEQRPVEIAGNAVIDILYGGQVAQIGYFSREAGRLSLR
jgi:hypothetical protein